ncbi:MAG: hypothetical protein HOA17_08940 [Candidatus Melainabacteria bacterium]|nr:hypothetical protein [Candidatus Melainabacteria bacterium]
MQTVDELGLVQKSNARNRAYYGSSAAVNMTQSGAPVPKKETVEAIMKLHEGFPAKPESK